MQSHLDKLRKAHRDLNRAIDTTRAPGRQEDVKQLKKKRLPLKDRIADIGTPPSPRRASPPRLRRVLSGHALRDVDALTDR